jgi:RHS repeat-associated protein
MYLSEGLTDKAFFPSGSGSLDGLIHNDHLGTPQKMTDGSGTIVWAADYKPFGEATITVSAITNNLRFPGQYYDTETGLNYNYFRDYNPAIGRYVEADPIGIQKGKNHLYGYVNANPVTGIDALGLAGCNSGMIQLELSALRSSYDAWYMNARANGLQWGPISNFMANFTNSPVCFDYAQMLLDYLSAHSRQSCCRASLSVSGPTLGWVHASVNVECRNDCGSVVATDHYDPWRRMF